MNKIYDFNEIEKLSRRQRGLVIQYILYSVCFVLAVSLLCILIENNILLSLFFAVLLFSFILFSFVFWKTKYSILNEYKRFLDNLDTGRKEDYTGEFMGKSISLDNGSFDSYTFIHASKKTELLIHKGHKAELSVGEKYHVECVGKYIYSWERSER